MRILAFVMSAFVASSPVVGFGGPPPSVANSVPPASGAAADVFTVSSRKLCDFGAVSVDYLTTNPLEFSAQAIELLKQEAPNQGCVTRATLVAGHTPGDEAAMALMHYVESEIRRYDANRRTFRSQNVSYAVSDLGRHLARRIKSGEAAPVESSQEFRFLTALLEPSWISIKVPTGRNNDAASRRQVAARLAFEALRRDVPDAFASWLTMSRTDNFHSSLRAHVREFLNSTQSKGNIGTGVKDNVP